MLVQAMEVLSLLKARGLALGTSELAVTELLDALAPVCNRFEEKMDFGLYFYNADRCTRFCESFNDPLACSTLLWDTAETAGC